MARKDKLRCEKCGAKESWSVRRGPTKPVFTCYSCGREWTCGADGGEWMLPRLKGAYDDLPPYQDEGSVDVVAIFTQSMGRRTTKRFEKVYRNPAMLSDTSRLCGSQGRLAKQEPAKQEGE